MEDHVASNTAGSPWTDNQATFARVVMVAAFLAMGIGTYWLVAWLVGVVPAWSPHSITTKTNMALSEVLSALALIALAVARNRDWRWWAGVVLALVVLLVGVLTLSEYLVGWNPGIDQLLAVEPPGALGVTSPNRMGIPGAASLALLGIGLLALAFGRKQIAAYSAVAVCVIVLVPAVGYVYGITQFYGKPGLTGIAWPAITALFSLSFGLFAACADSNPVARLFRDDPSGALLRRMLPAALLLPLLLGLLRTIGEQQGFYDAPTGRGLLVLSMMLAFSALLWMSAARLAHSTEVEREAQEALKRSEEQRRIALDAARLGTWDYNLQNGQLYWDERFREIWGLSSDEMPLMDVVNNLIHPDDNREVEQAISRALDPAFGGDYFREYRIIRPDGAIRWIAASGRAFFSLDGSARRPVRFVGTVEDITDRKESEEALRQSEQRLRAIFDKAGVGIVEVDAEDHFTAANSRALDILGYSLDDFLGMTVHQLTAPEDQVRSDDMNERLHQGEFDRFDYEKRYHRADGSPVWAHVTVSAIRDSDGHHLGAITTIEDIAERKKAEDELRESRAKLQAVLDSLPVAVWIADQDGNVIEANGAVERVWGKPTPHYAIEEYQDYRGRWAGSGEIVEAADWALVRAVREGETSTGEVIDIERLDGTRGTILNNAAPVRDSEGRIIGGVAVAQDITEQRRVEEELRASEERFRSVVENMAEGLTIFDAKGDLIYQNPAALRIHGFDEQVRVANSELPVIWKAWDKEGRPVPFGEWAVRRIMRGETVRDQVLHVLRPDTGHEFWAAYNGASIRDSQGGLTLIFLTIHDITDQVRAEHELALRERRLRTIFASDMVGMIFWNTDGQITDANDRFLQMTGYTREDLVTGSINWAGMTPSEYTAADDYALNELNTTGVDTPYEKEYIRKDGSRLPIIIGASMLDDKRYDGVAFVLDITDRVQAEERVRNLNTELEQRVAQRTAELEDANRELEAFSYSVSHDLRAPLRAIDGFSNTLLKRYHDSLDSHGQDYLQRIRAASQRMAQLIDDILGLSRAGRAEMHKQQVDLSSVALEIIRELRESQPERNVDVDIQPNLTANADPHLLRIVLDNLVCNAWKFTGKKDDARIEVGSIEQDGSRVYYVKDNGAGFNPERADKLFVPFQRLHTEAEFAGTGIGLALVQRIIRRHGGRIWAEGDVGKGAAFFFVLGPNDNGAG